MFRAMLMLALSMGGVVQADEDIIVEGTVNSINFKQQKLNITHGITKGITGESTRDFAVQDPGMLEEVQVGNKIKFTVNLESDGSWEITDIEVVVAPPAKSPSKQK